MKATANAFTLGAYLPIPKFLDVSPTVHAALVAHVYHSCLDIICANLKTAERDGTLLSDPFGNMHHCHTPLASWIMDLPEQQMLACVLGNQSPFTLAQFTEFGDLHKHPNHHRDHTLNLLRQACLSVDPILAVPD